MPLGQANTKDFKFTQKIGSVSLKVPSMKIHPKGNMNNKILVNSFYDKRIVIVKIIK